LTKRIGFIVMRRVGVAPTRLLFGVIVLVWVLSFFIPSPNALLATLAPLVIGIIATLGVGPQSNLAKGLFVSLTYMPNHVGKLLLGAGGTAMAYGLIEARTGIHVWWSQWLVAFLPSSVLTVVACYLTVRWLYPCETPLLSGGQQSLQEVFPKLGPWTRDEKKALGWMLLAIALWGTDFIHHMDPAVIALGVGLCLTLPHIGLLDAQALKQMNFLLIFFIAGAMSMGTVLTQTKALHVLMDGFVSWLGPLLTHAFTGAAALYWGAFLYHFVLGNDQSMVATSLPVMLEAAISQGYNPAAVGLAWTFSATGKLFVYQSGVAVAGYAYGHFEGKDWFEVNIVMTLVQGLILIVLVPVYWPLIGLPWQQVPQAARLPVASTVGSCVTRHDATQTCLDGRQEDCVMVSYKLISSDFHVVEPPDLWTQRIEPKFRERAPQVVQEDDGDWWFVDGYRTNSFQGGAQAGRRFEHPDQIKPAGRFADVRPGAYLPDAHIQDNEADGVYGSVMYPTEGLHLYSVPDSALLSAIFRVYNDWIADFCSAYPSRLKGIAMINVDDVQEAIKELERTRKRGLVGAMISVYPAEHRSYDCPEYEPFWAAAQNLDMPLSLHISTNRPTPGLLLEDSPVLPNRSTKPSLLANADHWVRVSLGHLIFAGVFERYPQLRVGSAEHELSWVPHFLERIDYTYTQRPRRDWWYRFKGSAVPSDFFHRNVFLSFQEDHLGIRDRDLIGVDTLMWGSDYPHTEATFPRSQQILERILDGVPEDERQKIVSSSVARLYHFSID
jgi:di/tricarboxylate transporter/predicted TIM-barrel fold metal-dependent hydrolase